MYFFEQKTAEIPTIPAVFVIFLPSNYILSYFVLRTDLFTAFYTYFLTLQINHFLSEGNIP